MAHVKKKEKLERLRGGERLKRRGWNPAEAKDDD